MPRILRLEATPFGSPAERVPWYPAIREATTGDVVSRAYGYARRVSIVSDDGQLVVASVIGTRPYRVIIDREGDTLWFSCTCDDFRDRERACKHLVAAALTIDGERGALATGRNILDAMPIPASEAEPAPVAAVEDGFNQLKAAMRGTTAPRFESPRTRNIAEIIYGLDLTTRLPTPVVRVFGRLRGKAATPAAPKLVGVSFAELRALPEVDRNILGILNGSGARSFAWGGVSKAVVSGPADYESLAAVHPLGSHLADVVLPLMSATGRLRSVDAAGKLGTEPLVYDAATWRAGLVVTHDSAGGAFVADVQICGDAERIPVKKLDSLTTDGWFRAGQRVGRAQLEPFHNLRWANGAPTEFRVPAAAATQLLDFLHKVPGAPPVHLPPELAVIDIPVVPLPRLVLAAGDGEDIDDGGSFRGVAHFAYDDHLVAADDEVDAWFDVATRRRIRRDDAAEVARLDQLHGIVGHRLVDASVAIPPARLVPVAVELAAAGWRVELAGKPYRTPGKISIEVTSGTDWFDVDGDVSFDGQHVPFPRLLEAVKQRRRVIVLADGSMGGINDEMVERVQRLARFATKTEGDALRYTPVQAGLLDALLASVADVTVDAAFKRLRKRLQTFTSPKPVDPAATFIGELRPYQREGLGWLQLMQKLGTGGCLADDMGLGKTVQVLAHLDQRRKDGLVLIVSPRSLVFNWKAEAAKFAPKLRVFEHTAGERPLSSADFTTAAKKADVVLTTYGLLRRDIAWLKDVPFDTVVLDEAQTIKNASSDTAKAARLVQARHRFALSGTPVENQLSDLWSLFEFLNPGMLGGSKAFEAATSRAGDPEALPVLARALRPYLLRRTKEQVAPELPAKTEQVLRCELEGEERALYDELRDHYRASLLKQVDADGVKRSSIQILTALLRLRQAACHPGLIDARRAKASSAKLDALVPSLREVIQGGHKALVFSQFTSFLDIVETRLRAEGLVSERLDGATRDRQARVARFRSDDACSVFLISLKAGGLGLNLVEADYVFLLDPWWNPAVESQAIDRTHRIGQTRPVTAYRLVAADTVEERVLELQARKRALAAAVISTDEGFLRTLTRADIERIFA